MSVLERIACCQGRRDEVPNQELARQLVQAKDRDGIREIATNLRHKNVNVRSDCVKVLYEIGYLDPALIADHAGDVLKHAESTLVAVDGARGAAFVAVLEKRLPDLIASQAVRVKKTIQAARALSSH